MADELSFRESITKVHYPMAAGEYVMSAHYVDGLRDDMREIVKQRLTLGFQRLSERKGWAECPPIEFLDGPPVLQQRLKRLDGTPADEDALYEWYDEGEVPEGHMVVDTGRTLCTLYGRIVHV